MSQYNYYLKDTHLIPQLLYIFAETVKEQANNNSMLYQLKNGRTIELSLEQFLEMSDLELEELEGLGVQHTMEITNPFYNTYQKNTREKKEDLTDEHELGKINEKVRRDDKYFHNKDDD